MYNTCIFNQGAQINYTTKYIHFLDSHKQTKNK